MVTLHYAEHVHIAQTRTWIPTPYFCVGQESESVPECVSGNVNEPLLANVSEYKPIDGAGVAGDVDGLDLVEY